MDEINALAREKDRIEGEIGKLLKELGAVSMLVALYL